MVPEACEPTCTVVTACKVPVAVTVLRRLPRSTRAVMYSAALARSPQYQTPPTATRATAAHTSASRLLVPIFALIHFIARPPATRLSPAAPSVKPFPESNN
jgi:hypothetical protein